MTKIYNSESKKKLWLAAIKPPMYTVAIMPIILGSSIAFYKTNQFNPTIFWLFLSGSIFILAWLNLSNDVFDAETGIDIRKTESIVNITQNKNLIFLISNIFLTIGILEIVSINILQKKIMVLILVLLCCALGYSYQGPPFRFGYKGLGEIICFFCFGPLAISAVYYSQAAGFSISGLAASLIIGLNTSLILFCSHFHQVEDDLSAGKLSPIVRIGTLKGAKIIVILSILLYLLPVIFIFFGLFPPYTLLILISFPIAYKLIKHMQANHAKPDKIRNSKYIAVKLHFSSNLMLAIGFVITQLLHY